MKFYHKKAHLAWKAKHLWKKAMLGPLKEKGSI